MTFPKIHKINNIHNIHNIRNNTVVMNSLPKDLWTQVYEYDTTYRDLFSRVLKNHSDTFTPYTIQFDPHRQLYMVYQYYMRRSQHGSHEMVLHGTFKNYLNDRERHGHYSLHSSQRFQHGKLVQP
jgi:hypothetical protein